MAKPLTAKQRASMPKKEFGQPAKRGFPMNDKKHDRLAIGGATRSFNAGNISKSTETKIKAEAKSKLGDTPMKKAREAKTDVKRDMKSAAPVKDRHGNTRLIHKGDMPKGSKRADAKGYGSIDGWKGMKGKC